MKVYDKNYHKILKIVSMAIKLNFQENAGSAVKINNKKTISKTFAWAPPKYTNIIRFVKKHLHSKVFNNDCDIKMNKATKKK